jgi:hypothetical protein
LFDGKKIYKTIKSYFERKNRGENGGHFERRIKNVQLTMKKVMISIIYPNVKMEKPLENQKINTTY